MNAKELTAIYRKGGITFPGGYSLVLATRSGVAVCWDCITEERSEIWRDTSKGIGNLQAIAFFINWESTELYCDLCSDRIPSEYAEKEEE